MSLNQATIKDTMFSDISFDVVAEQGSPFFGRLVVSNIRPKGSNPVKVEKFLFIVFTSPALIRNSDVNPVTHPWVDITPVITNKKIGTSFHVKAKLNFHNPYTFNGQETFTFYVNGDLGSDPAQKQFTETFSLAVDQEI